MRSLVVLLLISPMAVAQKTEIKTTEEGAIVSIGGKPFTTLVAKKEGLAKPYLYPILAPSGRAVTRDWPMKKDLPNETKDHIHQKSAWFCHGDVIPDGVTLKVKSSDKHVTGVDFWAESPGHGTIVTKSTTPMRTGSTIIMRLEWKAPEGLTILTETRFYSFSADSGGRLIWMVSELTAHQSDITFGDTKEGAFGIRVSDALRMTNKTGDGMLTNSEGKSGMKECWGYLADWCDYSGTVDGEKVGVAVFDHPKNSHRAYWHARDYGLLAANPFGRKVSGFPGAKEKNDLVKLEKGKTMTLQYGIFAHDGDAKTGRVAEAYKAFAK